MVMCKYFLEGRCVFGANCKNEHSYDSTRRYFAPQQQQPQVQQSQARNFNDVKQVVTEELRQTEGGKQWLFSCFSPLKEDLMPGLDDISPEELRFDAYQSQSLNNFDAYKLRVEQMTQDYMAKRTILANMDMNLFQQLFCKERSVNNSTSQAASSSVFGNTSTQSYQGSSVFGGATSTTPQQTTPSSGFSFGLLGQPAQASPSKSIFGSSTSFNQSSFGQNPPPYGQTTSSIFGQTPSTPAFSSQSSESSIFGGQSVFGQAASPGVFGQAATAPGPGIFGQTSTATTATSTNVFGQALTTPTSSNVFGQTTTTSNTNVFGQTAAGSNVFGQATPTPNTNVFGQAVSAPSANVFGQSEVPPGNVFGQSEVSSSNVFGQTAPPASNVFGQPSSNNVFGQPTSGAPVFGQTTPISNANNMFNTPSSQNDQSNVFGQSTFNANPPTFASQAQFGQNTNNVFGQQSANVFTSNAFTQPQSSAFEQGKSQFAQDTNSNPFSQSTPEPNPFTQAANKTNNYYSLLADLTEEVRKAFEAPDFELGSVPTVPPPRELCF